MREHHFLQGVHLGCDDRVIGLRPRGGPVARHKFVGHAPEQQRINRVEVRLGKLVELGVHVVPSDVVVRTFKVSVDRHHVLENHFSHGPYPPSAPGWYVSTTTPLLIVRESTSVSSVRSSPSPNRRLPPRTTIGWTMSRNSSTRLCRMSSCVSMRLPATRISLPGW